MTEFGRILHMTQRYTIKCRTDTVNLCAHKSVLTTVSVTVVNKCLRCLCGKTRFSCLLMLNNRVMEGNSPEPQRTSWEWSLTLCFTFNNLMTDPQVTKLSSVPIDRPTTQYNNNKIAGSDCERTARPKLPITDPHSLSQICNILCYVSKVKWSHIPMIQEAAPPATGKCNCIHFSGLS